MKILLAGGGSGGPVSPLLAVSAEINKTHKQAEFLLVGTKTGPEGQMAKSAGINFAYINAPKFRRYFSLKNIAIPVLLLISYFEAKKILKTFPADCVFGTGSFVQVPLVWAAWMSGIPVVLHQQDVIPSLANRLCQFAAKKITVTFPLSLTSFYSGFGILYKKRHGDKVVLTGNPFREQLHDGSKDKALKEFGLNSELPTLLVLGGGTGAEFLNNLIVDSLPQLSKTVQIIHSTGAGKFKQGHSDNYHPFEFISNMADAYAVADIVLARAGISTITELSNLKKLSIIVAMPNSHQEANALYLLQMDSAIVLKQQGLSPRALTTLVRRLIFSPQVDKGLKENIAKIMPHTARQRIAEIILNYSVKPWPQKQDQP